MHVMVWDRKYISRIYNTVRGYFEQGMEKRKKNEL